jgi:hypothetical protein
MIFVGTLHPRTVSASAVVFSKLSNCQGMNVEHVVAVRVNRQEGRPLFFVTWGRIQDVVDGEKLEAIVFNKAVHVSGGGNATSAHLCQTLQEAKDEPYFFEALVSFSSDKIPFGDSYEAWRVKRAQ